MKIIVCLGSSCHLRGSKQVVDQLQYLIAENRLKDVVELSGAFCMGRCRENGVNLTLDGKAFSVLPDTVKPFFEQEVLTKLA